MWILNFSFESIVTPKSFSLILFWPIWNLLFCWWGPIFKMLHLLLRMRNTQLSESWPSMNDVELALQKKKKCWKRKLVWSFISSAKCLAVADGSRWSVTSFTSRLNNKGPSTLPWGTPLATRDGEEGVELILTDLDLLNKNAAIQWYKLSSMP